VLHEIVELHAKMQICQFCRKDSAPWSARTIYELTSAVCCWYRGFSVKSCYTNER